jgi:FtsH-binding integral membrane protein
MVLGLTFYALITPTDFTMCGGLLSVLCWVLIGASVLNLFLKIKWLNVGISIASVLLFSVYLIYDTQIIVGGNHQRAGSLSSDEYIFGAMMLYIDIIILFLELLKLFGNKEN